MSRTTKKTATATVGGLPRVDLLPPEVRAERRSGVAVRRAWMGVIGAAAIVGIAVGGATLRSMEAQDELLGAQSDTAQLLLEQGKYTEVRDTKTEITLLSVAQAVAGSTEIAWPSYLAQIESTLPDGVVITSIMIDQATPVEDYAQSDTALQAARIGTVTFTAQSTSLPSVPDWLDGLTSLPGYTDATPGTVTLEDGVYETTVTMHMDQRAFSNRFALTEGE
jgi:Tfp pilus assembly protein PilN